ncbi:6022_t:CDS:1, partial [Dentiscutata heterogama]
PGILSPVSADKYFDMLEVVDDFYKASFRPYGLIIDAIHKLEKRLEEVEKK